MQFDERVFTDSQHSQYSALLSKKRKHLLFIEKEKKVDSEKGDSYICKRAQNALENAKNKVTAAKEYYDKVVRQAKIDYDLTVEKYEKYIELQESIVNTEINKKNPAITRALLDVESIDKEIAALNLPVKKETVTVKKVEESSDSSKMPEDMSRQFDEYFAAKIKKEMNEEEQEEEQNSFKQDKPSFPPTISNTKLKKPVKKLIR